MTEQNFREVLEFMIANKLVDPTRITEKDYVLAQVGLFMEMKDEILKEMKRR